MVFTSCQDFYDWQPGRSSVDNGCQTKKRNEERERRKWSYPLRSYGSSEEGAELGSRKVVNRQLTLDQRAAVASPGATGLSSSYQQHQQPTLSDSDEVGCMVFVNSDLCSFPGKETPRWLS